MGVVTALIYATLTLLIITLVLICTVCMMEIKNRIDNKEDE